MSNNDARSSANQYISGYDKMGIMTNAVILIVIVLFCYNANFNPWIILINIAFIHTIAESELKAAKEDAIVENAEIIQEYYI